MEYIKIGLTLEFIGSILIAYTVLQVHYRFQKEHKIDEKLFLIMRREQFFAMVGIFCLLLGYIFQILGIPS